MDEFEKNKKIVNERKKLNDYKRKVYAQKRLESNITKKIKTTMIGSLATFENIFGYLWGIDEDDDKLTTNQNRLRDLWEEARSEILTKGNAQIRAAQEEIDEYNLEWNGYKINFIMKDNNNE